MHPQKQMQQNLPKLLNKNNMQKTVPVLRGNGLFCEIYTEHLQFYAFCGMIIESFPIL